MREEKNGWEAKLEEFTGGLDVGKIYWIEGNKQSKLGG